jgi:hypothetical protein
MLSRVASLKRLFVGLAVVAALSVAPAMAFGTPTLTDAGSSFWTVRVNGANFSPANWVYVEVIDRSTGVVSNTGYAQTSPSYCYLWFCAWGGSFSYYGAPNTQCGAGRDVWAYDYGYWGWVGPITVGCA